MKKLSFLKSTISLVLLLSMSLLLTNCSSSNDDDHTPSNGTAFNVADFALTYTNQQLYNDYLIIHFNIKNTSKTSYLVYEQGTFTVKFTAKTTDGEVFQRTQYVEYVEAGVTYTESVHLNYTVGKTLDLTTLTAVVVRD